MYQPHNALLAMEVMRGLFGENGHPHLWKEALEAVRWRGRMEEVLPGVYVDGAHNISAVKRLQRQWKRPGLQMRFCFPRFGIKTMKNDKISL